MTTSLRMLFLLACFAAVPAAASAGDQASLFIDDELHVPIRLVDYGWQRDSEKKPLLLEEYNYVNLRLNVGFADDLFDRSRYVDDE